MQKWEYVRVFWENHQGNTVLLKAQLLSPNGVDEKEATIPPGTYENARDRFIVELLDKGWEPLHDEARQTTLKRPYQGT